MTNLIGSAFPGASSVHALALDVFVKATLLLVLSYAVHAGLGRRRALGRSALWNATKIGLLLLPLAGLAVPHLRIAVLPATGTTAAVDSTPPAAAMLSEKSDFAEESARIAPVAIARATPTESVSVVAPASREPAPEMRIGIAGILAVSYLAVAVLLAIRLGLSLVAVRGLLRRCERLDDRAWLCALERTQEMLNVSQAVALAKSDSLSVPLVVGWSRPVIVIPDGLTQTANAELIGLVLLHELAHVRRGDYAWNLVHKLVRLIYWPHPLVWPLGRIVASVREQACDDLCVHRTGNAAAYRASLLEVASGLVQRPELSLGLAMARQTNLARRLAWIESSPGKSRCLLSLPARLAIALAVVALTGVIGSIEIQRQALSGEQRNDRDARSAERQPPAIEVVVSDKETGKRLPGATVRFSIDFGTIIRKADENGEIRFDLTQRKFQDSLGFDVWADGYVQQRYFFAENDARYPKIPARFTVGLLPGEETLGGTVIDEQKRPIAGATVVIWGYLGQKKEEHELAYRVDATTDQHGQWRCRCFRGMTFAFLYVSHPDYLSDGDSHPRRHGKMRPDSPALPGDRPLAGLRDFSDVQVMTAGVSLAGKVTDEQDQPIAGAEVGWLEENGQTTFHDRMPVTSTNAAGRFRFPHVRPGKLVIQVKAQGHAPELKPLDAIDMEGHLTVKLGPPRTLSGRTVDSSGKPIADVFVNVDTWRGYRSLGVFLKTDADGTFRWDDAPPDTILINASRAGFAGIVQRTVSGDENAITLILKRSLSFSGRIRDAATDKPVDQTDVEVGVADARTGEIVWTRNQTVFSFQGRLQGNIDVEKTPELRIRITAAGYEPAVSRVFRRDENQVDYDVKLTKSSKPHGVVISGVVRRPNGKPLEGAVVTLTYPMDAQSRLRPANIVNGQLDSRQSLAATKTDATGRFSLGREPDPAGKNFGIVVIHPDFYALVDRSAFETNATINAEPWGRIEGVAYERGKPAAAASIRYHADRVFNPQMPGVIDTGESKADGQGKFVFERVAPGDVRVARNFGEGSRVRAWSNGELFVVRPGETVRAEVGNRGRPVVAKIVAPVGFDQTADYLRHSEFDLVSDRPWAPFPRDVLSKHDDSAMTWARQWWVSAEGHEYRRTWHWYSKIKLQPDGSIRVDDVPPGEYRLNLTYSTDPVRGPGVSPARVAYATKQFRIPEIPGGRSDEPFDLGVLRPKPKQTLKVGQPAPAFDVEALNGGRIKLEDFRGKFVLLDFWATWCGPCVAEIPGLKELHDRFGKDQRFAMVSLSLDADKTAPRKFVAEKAISWKQGFLGEWAEGGMPSLYHVEAIPAVFLIGPDGTLLSNDLGGEAIAAAVAQALQKR